MSLFNKNDIVVASREATLQIIEQIKNISKDVHLSDLAREDFNEKLGFLKSNTEKLSLILSVVGIMKAGKSTLINSIVGSEILPSRGTAMTVIPTYIKHNDTISGVIYKFKHADKFSIFLSDLQKAGFIHSLENSALSKRLYDENFVLHKELNNLEHIHEQLEVINDLCRISMSDSNTYELILDAFKQDDDFPILETCFKSIKDLEAASDISNFVLVDTPGVNEAKLPKLKDIVNKQISRSSALLLVLNYTDLASDADENMRSKIVSEAKFYKDRLIVAVNRFDAKDQKSMKKNETIRYVKDELLDEIELDNDFIFPVSARNALLGRQSLDWLENEGKFNLSTLQGWQRDFLDNTTSGDWDEDDEDDLETINNITETKRHAKKLLKSSRIGDFINTAINRAYQNAGPDTLIAALSGLRILIKDSLSFTLEADLDSATRTISELQNRIIALERSLKLLNDLSYSTNQKLTFWHKNTSSVINEYLDEKVSKLNISSKSEQSSEMILSFKHRKEAETKEKAEKAKKDLFEKINIEFTTIEADIQKMIQSSVIDISHSIEKDVNGFSTVLEHEVLDGFKMSTKSLDFKITFDSDAVNTKDFITKSTDKYREPRNIFGFTLSWLPKFTYAEYTTTSYNVDAIKLVQSITKMLESSLKDQMIEFRDQLKIIVADYEKDIELLCEIIRHSSKEAIENVNISTEEQLQKKSFCDHQLNELDNINEYALEVKNGLNEIRGAV